ncbi:MAG: helix-turn-helix transcriptional regulator [Verrucomicrobia bacterium]|nr:helix-turn-helix transcriptional regulator [Verrucomicrobiota bacterium]
MPLRQVSPPRKAASAHLEHELRLIRSCEIMAALTLLRGRWKIPILWNLGRQKQTLADLRRVFVMASEKMLSQHLAELLRDGFVEREVHANDRRIVSYTLTPLGRSLQPTLHHLREWGASQAIIPRATAVLETAE